MYIAQRFSISLVKFISAIAFGYFISIAVLFLFHHLFAIDGLELPYLPVLLWTLSAIFVHRQLK